MPSEIFSPTLGMQAAFIIPQTGKRLEHLVDSSITNRMDCQAETILHSQATSIEKLLGIH